MLEWKVMEIWHDPDLFTWDTGEPSLMQSAEMVNLSRLSRLGRFIEFIAAHGYKHWPFGVNRIVPRRATPV